MGEHRQVPPTRTYAKAAAHILKAERNGATSARANMNRAMIFREETSTDQTGQGSLQDPERDNVRVSLNIDNLQPSAGGKQRTQDLIPGTPTGTPSVATFVNAALQ